MKIARIRDLAALAASLIAPAGAPAAAQTEGRGELIAERIHSHLPLYTFAWEDLWPRNFYSEDSFGCESRVGFGDWRFTPSSADAHEGEFWHRYSNYGVFHCAAIMSAADDRASLDEAEWQYGFFVRIGRARLRSDEWELWAIQEGTVPGSDYTLLAREAGQDGLIERFRVLQQRCPRDRLLETDGFDVWRTRYCSINSRAELLALARRMLRLPPMGIIERVPEISEGDTADPSSGLYP
jgi:hypothetical protein